MEAESNGVFPYIQRAARIYMQINRMCVCGTHFPNPIQMWPISGENNRF